MQLVTIVLACLACVGHGRRVQNTPKPEVDSSELLATLLKADEPAAGFQAAGARGQHGASVKSTASRSPESPIASLRDGVMADGMYEETNNEFWDPLNLAGQVGDEALTWFRASEIKHGRVAMLASLGYLLGANDVTFPGYIAGGVTFKSINENGVFSAWSKVPELGKIQIYVFCLLIEIYSEAQKPHYMRGGAVGEIPFFKGNGVYGDKDLARLTKAEMKHGRLAMFGIISFLINHNLPGAVPFLDASKF